MDENASFEMIIRIKKSYNNKENKSIINIKYKITKLVKSNMRCKCSPNKDLIDN